MLSYFQVKIITDNNSIFESERSLDWSPEWPTVRFFVWDSSYYCWHPSHLIFKGFYWPIVLSSLSLTDFLRNYTHWDTSIYFQGKLVLWCMKLDIDRSSGGSRIFPRGCANSQKCYYFSIFFAENCMKMKEFGPRGSSLATPLDPPIHGCRDFCGFLNSVASKKLKEKQVGKEVRILVVTASMK